jgi:hypothetical protein
LPSRARRGRGTRAGAAMNARQRRVARRARAAADRVDLAWCQRLYALFGTALAKRRPIEPIVCGYEPVFTLRNATYATLPGFVNQYQDVGTGPMDLDDAQSKLDAMIAKFRDRPLYPPEYWLPAGVTARKPEPGT